MLTQQLGQLPGDTDTGVDDQTLLPGSQERETYQLVPATAAGNPMVNTLVSLTAAQGLMTPPPVLPPQARLD